MSARRIAGRARALRAGDPSLSPSPDLASARRGIQAYIAPNLAQRSIQRRMLSFCDEHPDALLRTCVPGHVTASALVLEHAGERVLLTLHKKLGRWLQLGGHCDGDANLAGVALREAIEESGIEHLSIDPLPIDLDIHVIPARPREPEHLHLDTRFLIFAPLDARALASAESSELRWFGPSELERLNTDDSVRRLLRLAFG